MIQKRTNKLILAFFVLLIGMGVVCAADLRIINVITHTGGNLGGINGADILCNNTAGHIYGGTWKALIGVTGTTPSVSRNLAFDWPLKPGYNYSDPAWLRIGSVGTNGCFSFPLNSVFAMSGYVWTGLKGKNDLNNPCGVSNNNCDNWLNSNAVGSIGKPDEFTDENFLGRLGSPYTSAPCFAQINILCVEQPAQQQGGGEVPEVNKTATMIAIVVIAIVAGMLMFKKK